MTIAEHRLKQLCMDIFQNQKPKTLAYFRLSNPSILKDLQDFAADSNANGQPKPLLNEVLNLFKLLNQHMAEQEHACPTWGDFFLAASKDSVSPSLPSTSVPTEISVVFGGKYSKEPASISEKLVSKLVPRSKLVFTVSRSTCPEGGLPTNIKHFSKTNLDACHGDSSLDPSVTKNDGGGSFSTIGVDEFYDVMSMARDEWLQTPPPTTLVFYFTLGQHKGINPFARNLQAAENFHRALQKLSFSYSGVDGVLPSSSETDSKSSVPRSCRTWRVVLTGTDATLPSVHPPSEMTLRMDNSTMQLLKVPTYKISNNNFVYAMSKLGQYYRIANSVARLVLKQTLGAHCSERDRSKYEEIVCETKEIHGKILKHVTVTGEDGAYHGDDTAPIDYGRISIEELDIISTNMSLRLEEELKEHFLIAKQISICYTPLHANPWTEDAIQNSTLDINSNPLEQLSPSLAVTSLQRAFILEQVVKRLKNAISIDSAASSHLVQY